MEEYLIEGIEDAISKKTSLQENFKEQTQSVCSLLYNMFGAPNLSLYIAGTRCSIYSKKCNYDRQYNYNG